MPCLLQGADWERKGFFAKEILSHWGREKKGKKREQKSIREEKDEGKDKKKEKLMKEKKKKNQWQHRASLSFTNDRTRPTFVSGRAMQLFFIFNFLPCSYGELVPFLPFQIEGARWFSWSDCQPAITSSSARISKLGRQRFHHRKLSASCSTTCGGGWVDLASIMKSLELEIALPSLSLVQAPRPPRFGVSARGLRWQARYVAAFRGDGHRRGRRQRRIRGT